MKTSDSDDVSQKNEYRVSRRRMSLRRGSLVGEASNSRQKSCSLPEGRLVTQLKQTVLVESEEGSLEGDVTPSLERKSKGRGTASQRSVMKRVSIIPFYLSTSKHTLITPTYTVLIPEQPLLAPP